MLKKLRKIVGSKFCEIEIKITDEPLRRFSITGTEGEVVSRRSALRYAREYWESYFEDEPEEILSMNRRFGTNFRSAKSAAKFVLDTDGEYHGIDVVDEIEAPPKSKKGTKVLICTSCGQIRDTIADFFPELTPLFRYHLNTMVPVGEATQQAGEVLRDSLLEQGFSEKECEKAVTELYKSDPDYGKAWHHMQIPERIVDLVKSL